MAKLLRYTQKLFASNASANQLAEFGSLSAGTPARYSGSTITPTIVQALSNYLTGWFGAVIGQNSPPLEDMNALQWLYSYQLAYLMQSGVAEWDSGTTYYIGSFVSSSGSLYVSLQDNNLNNAVSNGSFWQLFTTNASQSNESLNMGLNVSVATNAMAIALKQADGSTNPSTGTGTVFIGFRSSTGSSGAYNIRAITGALSLTIPSGATLGQISGMDQYVWVYAMDNAGTIELAVSGVSLFPDNSIQSSTTISSGATSGSTLYSTTGRSNLPIRLIGRLLVNEVTAGTWASNTTDINLNPKPYPTITSWTSYPMTITGTTSNPTKGTVAVDQARWRRVGDTLEVNYNYQQTAAGSNGSGVYLFNFPGTIISDSNKITPTPNSEGTALGTIGVYQGLWGYVRLYDTSHFALIAGGNGNSLNFVGKSAGFFGALGDNATMNYGFSASVPIQGWSTFGP